MKSTKIQLVVLTGALALSGLAVAETGLGYMSGVTNVVSTAADGTIIVEETSKGVFLVENQPEGFSSVLQATCSATWVMGENGANKGSSWRCTANDKDGDGYLNTGTISAADWSDCSFKTDSGWGKYAGASSTGTCQPLGPFAGEDTSIYAWNAEWTLPQ